MGPRIQVQNVQQFFKKQVSQSQSTKKSDLSELSRKTREVVINFLLPNDLYKCRDFPGKLTAKISFSMGKENSPSAQSSTSQERNCTVQLQVSKRKKKRHAVRLCLSNHSYFKRKIMTGIYVKTTQKYTDVAN